LERRRYACVDLRLQRRQQKRVSLETVDHTGKITTLEAARDRPGSVVMQRLPEVYEPRPPDLYTSEADGFSHLYTIAPDGKSRQQLTKGRWEVRDVAPVARSAMVYLQRMKSRPFEQHLYRMSTVGSRGENHEQIGKHDTVVLRMDSSSPMSIPT